MKSVETQTELLECSGDEGASSEDAVSVIDDELEVISTRQLESVMSQDLPLNSNEQVDRTDEDDDDGDDDDNDDEDDEDNLGEEAKLKTIKRLNCSNLFNFNKLELLNERCSVAGQQQISDSSRNLCEHEVHVAIDEELEAAGHRVSVAGEGKRTREDSAGTSSVIFIQECPEVIL